MTYYARKEWVEEAGEFRKQDLLEHLVNTATGMRRNLSAFPPTWIQWAVAIGWIHDIGKTRAQFQIDRLEYDGDAYLGRHTSAGAACIKNIFRRFGKMRNVPTTVSFRAMLASVVAGHHGGLRNYEAVPPEPNQPKTKASVRNVIADGESLATEIDTSILPDFGALTPFFVPTLPPSDPSDPDRYEYRYAFETATRFLFSALVDADGSDAQNFESPGKTEAVLAQARIPSIKELRERLDKHMVELRKEAKRTKLNKMRNEVYQACCDAAEEDQGVFSLTAPTGLGKTLAMTAFALRHAEKHGLRRVIIVMPYTTIIDQNADVLRAVFGDNVVLEHHSALAEKDIFGKSIRRNYALMKAMKTNWDAPVIVTTNVQFYESLFTNRNNRARKLHNIPQSVVVFDEAQSMDINLMQPTLDMLRRLSENYGCSLLFSTATQPILAQEDLFPYGFPAMREVIPDVRGLFRAVGKRVKYDWSMARVDLQRLPEVAAAGGVAPYLARRIRRFRQALVITHLRDAALNLYRAVRDSVPEEERPFVYHLSARMCPVHRKQVLAEIRYRLEKKLVVRVISTQLIEAGVDIDFPVVFRALAGADSIAQAAGRCNRNGTGKRPGKMFIFRADSDPPVGILRSGLVAMDTLANSYSWNIDLTDPTLYTEYFEELYLRQVTYDRKGIQDARAKFAFETVGYLYHLIDGAFMVPVLVPYGARGVALVDAVAATGEIPQEFWRDAQQYVVTLYKKDYDALMVTNLLRQTVEETDEAEVPTTGYTYLPTENLPVYHAIVGLCRPEQSAFLLAA